LHSFDFQERFMRIFNTPADKPGYFVFLPIGIGQIVVLGSLIGSTGQASALALEAAIENCRMSVGRPIVISCMQSSGGYESLEACRTKAKPRVQACIKAAMNAANGKPNIAAAIPTESAIAAPSGFPASFVAPPRTISDITAILDSEKPDLRVIRELQATADAAPTGSETREALAQFYLNRGNARAQLGRLADSIADANKAIEAGRGTVSANLMGRIVHSAAVHYTLAGDLKKARETLQFQLHEVLNTRGAKGYQFVTNRLISSISIQMGDIPQAESYLNRNLSAIKEARTSGFPGWRTSYAKHGQIWESDIEFNRAIIFEARGQLQDAEAAYRAAELRRRAGKKAILESENPPTASMFMQGIDVAILNQARVKAAQGRLEEAEVDARRALLSRLKDTGKYHAAMPGYVMGLAGILVEQGRYAEAEQLARVAIGINGVVGVADDSQSTVGLLSRLGGILTVQRKPEAMAVYARIDELISNWDPQRRQAFELQPARIHSLYASGQVDAGIAAAEALVKRQIARVGEGHFDTAFARGTLAIGLARAGRYQDAIREFKAAIPVMVAVSPENAEDNDATLDVARRSRLRLIVETYFTALTRSNGTTGDVAEETFGLADTIRSDSVQRALAASSARAAAKDSTLAELVRNEQDLSKQLNAQLGTLNSLLSLSSDERDERTLQAINASITGLRAGRNKALHTINERFPAYADLVSPKPPTIPEMRTSLADDEAMLSYYFGQNASFVWAIPKVGPVAFARIAAKSDDIETKIRKLIETLEPQAAMISDIPPFDTKLAYELYELLLKPVESGWRPARNLIVVTNGALGLLPLSLLPTESVELSDDDVLFSGYRRVPWLVRTHAITTIPSAAALRTQRQLPQGKPDREQFVGFGDPYFSKDQQEEAEASEFQVADLSIANVTRGIPLKRRNSPKLEYVDSAELSLLPRLPDTAEELKSIALALQVDPSKVLFLGKNASERTVESMNLSGFKIVAFATHGLIPGELNGLTQPALALSSPAVTGEAGDGLLTMGEILGLKLDADWVILSACNTGAGSGAGAEAASGLGRAFFYAGTRALLVTNWSVHSQSARQLVSDLFRRQAENPRLGRSEALRQSMVALIDRSGYLNGEGRMEFAYAHPLFWAPYTIIGDGSAR
jgi:CHAT domain-containing protein